MVYCSTSSNSYISIQNIFFLLKEINFDLRLRKYQFRTLPHFDEKKTFDLPNFWWLSLKTFKVKTFFLWKLWGKKKRKFENNFSWRFWWKKKKLYDSISPDEKCNRTPVMSLPIKKSVVAIKISGCRVRLKSPVRNDVPHANTIFRKVLELWWSMKNRRWDWINL